MDRSRLDSPDQRLGDRSVDPRGELPDASMSRYAWSELQNQRDGSGRPAVGTPDGAQLSVEDRSGFKIYRNPQRLIVRLDQPDGVVYQYSKFDQNGQPTEIKVTDTNTGDWGYWKKEAEGLWRLYHKETPENTVLRGNIYIDSDGVEHRDGVEQSMTPPQAFSQPYGDGGTSTADARRWPAYSARRSNYPVRRASWAGTDYGGGLPSSGDGHVQYGQQRMSNMYVGPGPGGVPGVPPEGCRAMTGGVTPAVGRVAKSLLSGEYGTETPFAANGKRYVARVEPHPPDSGINHWHKGVSVYEAVS